MNLPENQSSFVEASLMRHAEKDKYLNKSEIITAVVEELGVPRPTVRRVKSELLVKLKKYTEVLR